MAEKIDMSLDDIIKRDRIPGGRRGGGARGGSRGGRGARAGGAGGRVSGGGRAAGGARKGGARSPAVKKVSAGGRQMKASGGVGNRRAANLATKKASPRLMNSDKWQHDKFIGEIKSASLMISNLDFGVSDQDIRELFSEFGALKKAAVHYDSSGRSLGKADVVFVSAADAARAQKKYNGVPLDGRPMSITPLVTASAKASIASRIGKALKQAAASSAPRARARLSGGGGGGKGGPGARQSTGRGTRGGGGARARGPRSGQRNPRSGPKKAVTAEELDADLDAYNTNKM